MAAGPAACRSVMRLLRTSCQKQSTLRNTSWLVSPALKRMVCDTRVAVSTAATTLLVVPKSIPSTIAMVLPEQLGRAFRLRMSVASNSDGERRQEW